MAICDLSSTLRVTTLSVLSAAIIGCGGGASTDTKLDVVNPSEPVSDWQLVWSDEFDGTSINLNNWTHEVNCQGGGNNEQQCYTDSEENSFVADGMLNIVALPAEEGAPLPYTSARLITQNKADFKYGRFEMRAKLPAGQGAWPAFWMMPTDSVYGGWPRSGEIDIVEAVNLTAARNDGTPESYVHGTLHYGQEWPNNDSSGRAYLPTTNPSDDFHTYAVEWQEGEIRWYMDDHLYATQRQSEVLYNSNGDAAGLTHRGWYAEYYDQGTGELQTYYDSAPFDQEFFMILNFAVGGDWPENVNELGIDADAFAGGNSYIIDYVRVYECAINPDTGKGCETVRQGYDDTDDALVLGAAPIPSPPSTGVAENLTIFDDELNPNWPMWDCCGGSTPILVEDEDTSRGMVAEFYVGESPTVNGFISREIFITDPEGQAAPFDATPILASGTVSFDLKLVSAPLDSTASWLFKIESNEASTAVELPITASVEGVSPTVGEWQTYTFTLQSLADAGLDVSAIDVIMVFPAWGVGNGATYRLDQVTISGDVAVPSELVMFADAENPDWPMWDCCAGSTPTVETDDDEHGAVAQFSIGATPTVMGFITRGANGGSDSPFDASGILNSGVVQFELKVVTAPNDGSADWKFKIESDGAATAVELDLTDSVEGLAPVTGEWQTYTYRLADLASAGLDVSFIDVVMIFPAWGAGDGAVYRVDNAKIYATEDDSGDDSDGGADGGADEGDSDTMGFAIGEEQLVNGSFDDGIDSWTAGTIVTEDNNNVYFAEVSSAGDAWSVNLSQAMTLEPNRNYVLSFRARASQERSIIAGLGLNHDPWTAVTENVALTTEWQTFSYQLTTMDPDGNGFGDDNSRVLFDMGAEVGDVYLDDVSVVFDSELLVNRSFDIGASGWSSGEVAVEGDNNYYAAEVSAAGNPWDVNLSQVISLTPNSDYILVFSARASQSRAIIAGIGLNHDPWNASTETVELNTDWQTFELPLTTVDDNNIAFGDDDSRVLFDLGAEVGDVHIDNVSLVQDSSEIISNGGFDEDIEHWNAGTVVEQDGNYFYQAEVTVAGNPWDVNLSQVLTLIPDTDYVLIFRAKSDVERSVLAGIGFNHDPWTAVTDTANLTTEWQTFTYPLKTTDENGNGFGDDDSRVLFDMGAEVGTVSIDDVSLQLADPAE